MRQASLPWRFPSASRRKACPWAPSSSGRRGRSFVSASSRPPISARPTGTCAVRPLLRSAVRAVRRAVRKRSKRLRLMRTVGFGGLTSKTREEIDNWQRRQANEGHLRNDWYEHFYTVHFQLGPDFYTGKRLLDIGCGPRGSLVWATSAVLRVGVDPLAESYRQFGTKDHRMSYVEGSGERLPVRDGSVDVVSSFNSLDHTDRHESVIDEIVRVLRPGGTFLLLVDINHPATDSEPVTLGWNIVDRFQPALELVSSTHFEHRGGVYQSAYKGTPFDHARGSERQGVLSAVFRKP